MPAQTKQSIAAEITKQKNTFVKYAGGFDEHDILSGGQIRMTYGGVRQGGAQGASDFFFEWHVSHGASAYPGKVVLAMDLVADVVQETRTIGTYPLTAAGVRQAEQVGAKRLVKVARALSASLKQATKRAGAKLDNDAAADAIMDVYDPAGDAD
jgi:hypothetical protein